MVLPLARAGMSLTRLKVTKSGGSFEKMCMGKKKRKKRKRVLKTSAKVFGFPLGEGSSSEEFLFTGY